MPKIKTLMEELQALNKSVDESDSPPTLEEQKRMDLLKRHLSLLSDKTFEESLKHQSLERLRWVPDVGMPEFGPNQFPDLYMRLNSQVKNVKKGGKTVVGVDFGTNPACVASDTNAHIFCGGIGLSNFVRHCDLKMKKLQSKQDNRGNFLAKPEWDKLNKILNNDKSTAEKMNVARSKYDKKRADCMSKDAKCKSWKRQFDKIKRNKEKACDNVREQLASFLSLFDVVIIGDNDLQQWHKGISHAASSVLSALALGELIKKLKFKIGQRGHQLVEINEAWTTKLCSCCGNLNDPGNSATYTCSRCKIKMNRDENGARYVWLAAFSFPRNILLLGLRRASDILDAIDKFHGVPETRIGGAPGVTT